MIQNICVFCSASGQVSSEYFETAKQTGEALGRFKKTLVYGGAKVGLMGETALACHREGGRVVGVIPEKLQGKEIAYTDSDELIVCEDMLSRKRIMMARSDAYICLAGGYGTLDEMLEVMTHRQLGYEQKPIFIVNTNGFYDQLMAFFENLNQQHFSHGDQTLFEVVPTPQAAIERLFPDELARSPISNV